MRKFLFLFFCFLVALFASVQPGASDPGFNSTDAGLGKGDGPNGEGEGTAR